MKVNAEDIIGAYKIFLDRQPESMRVVQARLGKTAETNLVDFALSEEFLKRPEVEQIIINSARMILEAEKMDSAANVAPAEAKSLN
jgi:hypothetical protein